MTNRPHSCFECGLYQTLLQNLLCQPLATGLQFIDQTFSTEA